MLQGKKKEREGELMKGGKYDYLLRTVFIKYMNSVLFVLIISFYFPVQFLTDRDGSLAVLPVPLSCPDCFLMCYLASSSGYPVLFLI